MIPRIIKKIKKKKDLLINIIIVLAIVIVMVGLYKMLFYSSRESSVYGVRLRDNEKYKIDVTEIKKIEKEAKKIEGTESVSIKIKGRLIKYYITVNNEYNEDQMKNVCNQMIGVIDEKKRVYYDMTFYLIKEKDGKEEYPLIGYKHKSKEGITFVEGGKNEEKEQ